MDAFTVSIAKEIAVEQKKQKSALLVSSLFGSFQMFMPALGYFFGLNFAEIIMDIDHWIALGLLVLISFKMISDSKKTKSEKEEASIKLSILLALSVATSIGALMVGFSLAFLKALILEPILTIGFVTFTLSFIGFLFGSRLGRAFGNRIKIFGGFILIAFGFRILLEHLF